ncbi:helix-turn-helix transcriptional regulator [Mycoplasmopsis arginini]|uniref:Helix-turn-helix transcriptional regulator n=1 Tax=Mycoplasmopsis arginini TaxID=2094 RepID=A0ABZ2AJ95_MYCAR|nr:helix-turn-helix transcriptional regulator [Mycoplasmopsis arginini]WVN22184.1 helix-turn-helix transcriptional regulator [Mycoplasmopsis arginini]VEU81591.1 transcriptional regulator [Mycoplasmopsis arginini]VEU83377.1 transcriptional regulator [Mycoplasmopsis arginini]VEU83403.1 transcriptional regulator [Mycoplasmopsis arginini]
MKEKVNYPEMIVLLRARMNISQEKLASKLGVSFQSVNRWENGKYEPTKLAKVKLKELFKEFDIKVIEE